jgi:hypothetical protein
MKRIVTAIFFFGAALAVTGVRSFAVEPVGPLSSDQARTLLRSAATSEDHIRLAGYYRDEAQKLRAEVKEHEEMSAEYDKNPAGHPIPKGLTLGEHCRNLVKYYSAVAATADKMAAMHEAMANRAR